MDLIPSPQIQGTKRGLDSVITQCKKLLGSPYGIVVNMLDYDFVVSEFELQLWDYIPFQKGINLFISPDMGYILPILFYKNGFDIK